MRLILTFILYHFPPQDNIIWAYSGASVDGLIVLRGGSMTIADTTFISTTIESNEVCSHVPVLYGP